MRTALTVNAKKEKADGAGNGAHAALRLRAHRCGRLCGLVLLWVCVVLTGSGRAANTFQPGFRTLGVWHEDKSLRLDINVWYPSTRRPSDLSYTPWVLSAARNGREVEGRFPLLLLSHDSVGSRFSHHETAALLARSGFVVAAPTHIGDNTNDMSQLFTLRQVEDRVNQLRSMLDVLLQHPDVSASIDPERVGAIGFGVGGSAVLLLGGALPQPQGWEGYCAKAGPADPYCSTWALPRMCQFAAQLPLKKSLADTRIRAVAAVAPSYGMFFTPEALRYLYPPLLLIRADADTINRAPLHADAVQNSLRELGKASRFTAIADIDAAGLMSPCPPALQKDIPELCGRATLNQRRKAHRELNTALGDFFLDTLGDSLNLPQIPAPPDLTPPPPPQPEVKEKPAPVKKDKPRARGTRKGTQ